MANELLIIAAPKTTHAPAFYTGTFADGKQVEVMDISPDHAAHRIFKLFHEVTVDVRPGRIAR